MSGERVVIISTGIGNTASVAASVRRCGSEAEITADASRVASAERVILPGVGSFGAGMASLREHGLEQVVLDRIEHDRPLLAICLGMQLLCESSEETPGEVGLGVVPSGVQRFPDEVCIPQFGWNRVEPGPGFPGPGGYAYFANSFRLTSAPEGWSVATSDHGGPFVAAMQRGRVLACQFHPELSGAWGQAIVRRWLESGSVVPSC